MRWFANALRLVLITLLMYAPLICLRYCELRAEMAGAGHLTSAERMVLHHEAALSGEAHTHGHAHGSHVPLDELRTMLAAVTEYVTPLLAIILILLVWQVRRPLNPLATHPPCDILTPPPRLTLA